MAEPIFHKEAAFLIRCSTDKQDHERQLDDLHQVADRFGFHVKENNIFGEYITGKDDTTKHDRLSIIKCRQAAEEHKFDVLLVAEVSRMSRDSVSGRVYVRQFCNYGIPVYFRDKMKWTINLETGKVDESFIKELGLYFDGAAEYLKSMKTQIASGRRSSLRNNQLVVGHVLLGYKKRGGKDKKRKSELIIDEETAPIVRDIFKMYLEEGASMKSVSLAISAKYNIKKTVSGIQQVLSRSEYYSGEYTIYMVDPDRKVPGTPNNKKTNKGVEGAEPFTVTFEPLIDKETFDAANTKRTENKSSRLPYPKQMIHPLSKLIKCPFCGHVFSPRVRSGDKPGEKYRLQNGKVAYSWICMTRINNAGDCDSHVNINDMKLETIIWDFIKKELITYADLQKDTRAEKIFELKQKIAEAQTQIPLYLDKINQEENIIKRAYNAYLYAPDDAMNDALKRYNDTLTKETKVKNDYIAEIDNIKKRVKSWENSIKYYSQSNITTDYIISIAENEDEKRKIFVQLLETITPYSISPGVLVLELSTINGKYYLLFDGNQRGNKRVAHYIASPFVVWHKEKEDGLQKYEKQSYFTLKNTDILKSIDGLDPQKVSYHQLEEFCAANGWSLPYNYIYEVK